MLTTETVAAGTALAVAECLRGGITTALDMYFFPEAARAVAARRPASTCATGRCSSRPPDPIGRSFDARLTWATDLLAGDAGRPAVGRPPQHVPARPRTQLRAVAALAAEHGARVHVHACETTAELAAVRARHGRTPIEVLRDTGLLGPGTVLAHGVHLTAADIELVADAGATVSHCPASNQKLASGFAPIPELLAAGVPVALGTDGAASANDLDLWVAMRLAAYPLAARTAPGTVDAAAVLAMATTGGRHRRGPRPTSARSPSAPALTWWSSTRRPRRSRPATTPIRRRRTRRRGPTCAGSSPAGRVVVDDRRLVTIDVDDAVDALRQLAPRILAATAR